MTDNIDHLLPSRPEPDYREPGPREPVPEDTDEHRLSTVAGPDVDALPDDAVTLADVKEAVREEFAAQRPEPGPNDFADEHGQPQNIRTAEANAAKRLQQMQEAADADAATFFDEPVSPGAEAPNTGATVQDAGNVDTEDERLRLAEIKTAIEAGVSSEGSLDESAFDEAVGLGATYAEIQGVLRGMKAEQVTSGRDAEITKLSRVLAANYQQSKPHDVAKCEELEQLRSQKAVESLRKMPYYQNPQ